MVVANPMVSLSSASTPRLTSLWPFIETDFIYRILKFYSLFDLTKFPKMILVRNRLLIYSFCTICMSNRQIFTKFIFSSRKTETISDLTR